MIELNSVKLFAEENKELYTAFKDYRDQWLSENRGVKGKAFSAKSLDDKANVINKLFAEELEKKVPRDGVDLAHYANSPMVKYFSDAIVDSMIDMVIPDVLNTSVGLIADIKYLDYGDSAKFDMKNNGLFTVAKAGYRQRNTIAQANYGTTVTLTPENHQLTVVTNMYAILADREKLAEYVMKAALSIEAEMLTDIWGTFETAASASTVPSALKVTNFTETSAVQLIQKVEAYNRAGAVLVGTELALANILPSNSQYRYFLTDEIWKLGHVQQFRNRDVIPVKQIADYKSTNYGLALSDSYIYVMSPAVDKPIKVVVGSTIADHTEDGFFNANLSISHTLNKAWGSACITNAIQGVITV